MGKVFWTIVSIAVILRFVLMPLTYHSDIVPFDLAGYVISKGAGLGFYDYIVLQDLDSPIRQVFPVNLFNYPPMVYFFLGSAANVFVLITPLEIREKFLFDVGSSFGDWRVNLHLILLKLIYIPFDIATAVLLWKLMTDKTRRLLVLGAWLLNPVVLFGVYMIGQFDIIPAFFTLLAFFVLSKNKSTGSAIWWSAIILGIGACFKIYPLLLLPVLASLNMSWVKRFGVVVAGLSVYLLSISPFLFSSGFRSSALVASQTTKSLYAQIPLSGGESVMIYIAVLVFVYLVFLTRKTPITGIWSRMMIVLLVFFIFTHYHPQWLVWLMPFLVLEVGYTRFKNWLVDLIVVITWFGSLWFFDPGMTTGLFVAIWPWLYDGMSVWRMVGINVDYNYARSLLASVFFGGGLYLLIQYLPLLPKDTQDG